MKAYRSAILVLFPSLFFGCLFQAIDEINQAEKIEIKWQPDFIIPLFSVDNIDGYTLAKVLSPQKNEKAESIEIDTSDQNELAILYTTDVVHEVSFTDYAGNTPDPTTLTKTTQIPPMGNSNTLTSELSFVEGEVFGSGDEKITLSSGTKYEATITTADLANPGTIRYYALAGQQVETATGTKVDPQPITAYLDPKDGTVLQYGNTQPLSSTKNTTLFSYKENLNEPNYARSVSIPIEMSTSLQLGRAKIFELIDSIERIRISFPKISGALAVKVRIGELRSGQGEEDKYSYSAIKTDASSGSFDLPFLDKYRIWKPENGRINIVILSLFQNNTVQGDWTVEITTHRKLLLIKAEENDTLKVPKIEIPSISSLAQTDERLDDVTFSLKVENTDWGLPFSFIPTVTAGGEEQRAELGSVLRNISDFRNIFPKVPSSLTDTSILPTPGKDAEGNELPHPISFSVGKNDNIDAKMDILVQKNIGDDDYYYLPPTGRIATKALLRVPIKFQDRTLETSYAEFQFDGTLLPEHFEESALVINSTNSLPYDMIIENLVFADENKNPLPSGFSFSPIRIIRSKENTNLPAMITDSLIPFPMNKMKKADAEKVRFIGITMRFSGNRSPLKLKTGKLSLKIALQGKAKAGKYIEKYIK